MTRYRCAECDWIGEKLFDAFGYAEAHEIRRIDGI